MVPLSKTCQCKDDCLGNQSSRCKEKSLYQKSKVYPFGNIMGAPVIKSSMEMYVVCDMRLLC